MLAQKQNYQIAPGKYGFGECIRESRHAKTFRDRVCHDLHLPSAECRPSLVGRGNLIIGRGGYFDTRQI